MHSIGVITQKRSALHKTWSQQMDSLIFLSLHLCEDIKLIVTITSLVNLSQLPLEERQGTPWTSCQSDVILITYTKNVMQLSRLRSRSSDMRTQAQTGKEMKLSLKQKNETFTWTWVQKQGKSYRWSKQKLELGKTVTTMTKGDMNTILSRCMRGTMNMPLNRIMKKNLELGVT